VSDYPDTDWPYSFYFNGQELPKWSSQWHLCSLSRFLNNFEDAWDEWIGHKHIWFLQNRLDHLGTIESEDPLILRVCAQEVLLALIKNQNEVVDQIQEALPGDQLASEVYIGITDGIARMIELSHQDCLALWTNGYRADNEQLTSFISSIPSRGNRSDSAALPHTLQRRSELEQRSRFQLSDLRTAGQSGKLDKRLRKLVHQLPNQTELAGAPNP
jgi:hypothetical protein